MPRVLVVPDAKGWCWHRRALALQKHSPPGYTVDIVMQSDFRQSDVPSGYDAALWFDWTCPPRNVPRCWGFLASEGPMHPVRDKLSTSDFRERLAERGTDRETFKRIAPRFHGMICINPRATEFVRSVHRNTHYLTTGVDVDEFYPGPERPAGKGRGGKLRIGWCGKFPQGSRWTPKGFDEVLVPLMTRLGDRVEWSINGRTARDAWPVPKMREWYQSLDVFLVTSCAEGTPSVLLEAAACGVACVSTDVGIARELIEPVFEETGAGKAGLLSPGWHNESTASLAVGYIENRIGVLADMRRFLPALGQRARDRIESHFNWKSLAPLWLETLAVERKAAA